MKFKIRVIDEFGEIEEELGTIKSDHLVSIVNAADEEKMKCLSLIELGARTCFNEAQVLEIKKELEELKKNKNLSLPVLNLIGKGVSSTLKDVHLYLAFDSIHEEESNESFNR